MKKNNTAEKAALSAEKITAALKESTEKSLRNIINEAIANVVLEGVDDTEEDSYSVKDVEPDETPEVSDVETDEKDGVESVDGGSADSLEAGDDSENAEDADSADNEEAADNSEDDDEWSDLEQYKIGDDDYDFTGVDGDEILKVYNKLGDDDQIFVKKEDDGTYSVKDDETGAEFVIELNSDKLDAEDGEESFDADLDDNDSDNDFSIELDSDEDAEDVDSEDSVDSDDDEVEIDLGDDDDTDEDELNEDLGYTDSYQKDVFAKKINNSEPADKKATYSMDAGAPEGSSKPWAGKGDTKPFEQKVDECGVEGVDPNADANLEENGGTISSIDARHMKKGQIKQHRPNAPAYDVRKEDSPLNESVKKIVAKAKAIQAENKQYKESLDKIKKSLYEAAVLNVNLGKLVDLLVNETTTKDEKKAILNRFNNVRTISEGKVLYDTIKLELNESAKKASAPIVEKQFAANSLNESVIYSNQNEPSLDLMNRMDNLYKKQK